MNTPRVVRRPDVPEWLEELANIPNGSFPMEEMQLLWERGDEIEELLLQYLRWLADESEIGWLELEDGGWLHFIAFFLLADRGCPEVVEPLLEIAMDEDYADFVMGDAVTEDLPFWLAAVGTPESLRVPVENDDANLWLAVAALGALGTMAWDGRIPQEEHHDYLKELALRRERTDHPVWMEWLSQVGLFAWSDLLDTVAELEKAGMFYGKEGKETTQALINDLGRTEWATHSFSAYQPGGTAGLERFSKFPNFQPGYVEDEEDHETDNGSAPFDGVVPECIPIGPIPREDPKVGRNDPCPCGSGKKWKKCCGK